MSAAVRECLHRAHLTSIDVSSKAAHFQFKTTSKISYLKYNSKKESVLG